LAQLYRDRVAELTRLLAQDDAAEARELIRVLVEEIRLVPDAGMLRIEVRGALGAILALGTGALQASSGAVGCPLQRQTPRLVGRGV
jgi:hypothetical protein